MSFSNISDPFSLPQIVGYGAMALGILAFLQKDDKHMKMLVTVMTSLMCVHFMMLERFMAAFAALSAGSRAGLSIFEWVRVRAHYFAAFYGVLTVILLYFSYQNWVDLLAFMASIIGVFAFFYLHGLWLRYVLLLGGAFWLAHNIFAMSYGPAVMESFIMMANMVTIYRLQAHNRKPHFPKDVQL